MLRFHPAGFREAVFCGCRVGVGGPPFWPRERRSKVRRTPGTRDERESEEEGEKECAKKEKLLQLVMQLLLLLLLLLSFFLFLFFSPVVGTLLPCSPGQQCSHISLIFVANHKIRWSVLRSVASMSTSVVAAAAFFACHLLYKGSAESVTGRQGGREAGTQVGRHQRRSLLTTLVVGVKLLLQEEGRDRGDVSINGKRVGAFFLFLFLFFPPPLPSSELDHQGGDWKKRGGVQ